MAPITLIPLDQEDGETSPSGWLVTIGGLQGTNSSEPTKDTPKAEVKEQSQPPQKPAPKE